MSKFLVLMASWCLFIAVIAAIQHWSRTRDRLDGGLPPTAPTVAGRRLSSALSVADCRTMFCELAGELGGYAAFAELQWRGAPGSEPDLLVAAQVHGTAALYLAVWDRGRTRELNLVPASSPGQLPPTLIGSWKMRDGSLSSTGTVTQFQVAN